MRGGNLAVWFLYRTFLGRGILHLIQKTHADKTAVWFLKSKYSSPFINWYAKRHNIPLHDFPEQNFQTFQEFFARKRSYIFFDPQPDHLISPCDGYLSKFPIEENQTFYIKGSHYRLKDLLQVDALRQSFQGGDCLIFRLTPSDYHHYCYIDHGYQGSNHYIPGHLHSVQPLACETVPVFTHNRRLWTLLETENFGPVVQICVGALIVGGIVNEHENTYFEKGMEMGHFDLSGSTIVLLFQKNRICLTDEILDRLTGQDELRVRQGMCIGYRIENWGNAVS